MLFMETLTSIVLLYLRYDYLENHTTEQIIGSTDRQPLLETPGEVTLQVVPSVALVQLQKIYIKYEVQIVLN